MLRFMAALAAFAVITWLLGFGNVSLHWGGLARGLFFFYVVLLALCALATLIRPGRR